MAARQSSLMPPHESVLKDSMARLPSSVVVLDDSHEQLQSSYIVNGNGSHMQSDASDCMLHVTIHHARDIHNICIYGNQDVYAKFIITKCQDSIYSTQPVKSGGQNPVFNQSLHIPICGSDVILKCELWMMSCAKNYLEDQLLGFTLVPLKNLYGNGKQTQDYGLTSTDLFYTPAGTVRLSLSFDDKASHEVGSKTLTEGSDSTCSQILGDHEVIMDYGCVTPENLCRIEFLDLEAASEDQQLVSMYYKMAAGANLELCNESTSTLQAEKHDQIREKSYDDAEHVTKGEAIVKGVKKDHSGDIPEVQMHPSPTVNADGTMICSPRKEKGTKSGSFLHKERSCSSGFPSSIEPDKASNSAATESAVGHATIEHVSSSSLSSIAPQAGASSSSCIDDGTTCEMQEKDDNTTTHERGESSASAFTTAPLVSISLEPEISINQEHFVDLYLKSMQQFTEKLADMKFSFDVDPEDTSALQNAQVEKKVGGGKKGSKLYYGSRAFY